MHLFLPPLLRLFPHIPLLTDRKFSCIHLLLSSKRYIVSCVGKSRILTLLDSAISAALLVRCSALVQHIDFIIVANKTFFAASRAKISYKLSSHVFSIFVLCHQNHSIIIFYAFTYRRPRYQNYRVEFIFSAQRENKKQHGTTFHSIL